MDIEISLKDGKIAFSNGRGDITVPVGPATVINFITKSGLEFAGLKIVNGPLVPIDTTLNSHLPLVSEVGKRLEWGPYSIGFVSASHLQLRDCNSCKSSFFYSIGVKKPDGSGTVYSDPMIYNQGGGPLEERDPECQQRLVAGGTQVLFGTSILEIDAENKDYPIVFAYSFASPNVVVVANISDPGFGESLNTTGVGTRNITSMEFSALLKTTSKLPFSTTLHWVAMGPTVQ